MFDLHDDVLSMRCSAHHFAYNSSMFAVNEHFQRVAGEGSDPQTARWLAVNHYITRSKQVPNALPHSFSSTQQLACTINRIAADGTVTRHTGS